MATDLDLEAIEARLGIDDDAELTMVWTYPTIVTDTEALLAEVKRLRARDAERKAFLDGVLRRLEVIDERLGESPVQELAELREENERLRAELEAAKPRTVVPVFDGEGECWGDWYRCSCGFDRIAKRDGFCGKCGARPDWSGVTP